MTKEKKTTASLNVLDRKFEFERSMSDPIFKPQETGIFIKDLRKGDRFKTAGGVIGRITGIRGESLLQFCILEGKHQNEIDWISKEAFVTPIN